MGSFQKQTPRIQVQIVSLRGDPRKHWLRRGETGKEMKTVMGVLASQFLAWVTRGQSHRETLEDGGEHASEFYPQGTRKVEDLFTNSPIPRCFRTASRNTNCPALRACPACKPNVLQQKKKALRKRVTGIHG